MKFPLRRVRPGAAFLRRVPDAASCTFSVHCLLSNQYRYTEGRWKSIAEEWLAGQNTAPLTRSIERALQSRAVRIVLERQRDIPTDLLASLAESGASEEILETLQCASHAIVVEAADDLKYPRSGLWAAYLAAQAIAAAVSGHVVDVDARRIVPGMIPFHKLHTAGVPRIEHFVSVEIQRARIGVMKACTRGFVRFGVPELELQNEAGIPECDLKIVLYAIAQTLAIEIMMSVGALAKEGSGKRVPAEILLDPGSEWVARPRPSHVPVTAAPLTVHLRTQSRPGSGSVLAVRPSRQYPGDARQWLEEAAGIVCPNRIAIVRKSVPVLPPVSREEINQARRAYDSDFMDKHRVSVRFKVDTSDGPEYQWLRVMSWLSGTLRGCIVESPDDPPDMMSSQIREIYERDIVQIERSANTQRIPMTQMRSPAM